MRRYVTCSQCTHFIPNPGTARHGIGDCKVMNDYRAKNPGIKALEKAEKVLGDKLRYPNVERVCGKYEGVK